MNWITRLLLAFAKPFRNGHLYHADGSLYMERFALFETRWLSARVHHIATADLDRDLHDHPWAFVSVVLSGGYVEERPENPTKPQWHFDARGRAYEVEMRCSARREAGTFAFRRPTDRHLISQVDPRTWTLFIYGPGRQWWGFYTPFGKVHWREYPSVHGRSIEASQ